MRRLLPRVTIAFLLLFLLPSSASCDQTALTLQLRWKHQFQFAGYYAALHKGFYKDAGLDVKLKEGGPAISATDEVLQGHADFGVSTSGLIKAYLEGKPVLMLAPIFQHSPLVLLSLGKKMGNPADIAKAGAISLQPGDESLELKAMFINEGLPLDKLNITSGGLEDLLAGKIIAMNAYLSNEPFLLQKRAIPYRLLKPDQYGMDFYSDILFTSRAVEKARPKAVAAFRAASLKGWEYALNHQDEIIDLILANYNTLGKSREALRFEAKALFDLTNPDFVQVGHSNPERWRRITSFYAGMGVLPEHVSLNDTALKNFLYDPNPPPQDLSWLYRALAAAMIIVGVTAFIAFYIYRLNLKLQASEKQVKGLNVTLEQRVVERTAELESALQRLHESQKELVRSEANATLSTLIASVSHELGTPIGNSNLAADSLSAQAHELREKIDTGAMKRSDFDNFLASMNNWTEIIARNLNRANELLKNFRQVTADQASAQRRQFDLANMVQEVIFVLAPTLKRKPHQIKMEIPPGILMDSQPGSLGQIVINLINNAYLHAFENRTDGVLTISAEIIGDKVKLSFADNGVGIPEDNLEKIFKPFFSTKIGKGGTGLGMAIVENLIQKTLGGEITVHSTVGVGTRFDVVLPLVMAS